MSTQRTSAGQIVAMVVGALLALASLGIVAGGAAVLIGQKYFEEDGFLTTPTHRVSTDTYALATKPIDIDGISEWPFDDGPPRVRLKLDAREDVFVGVARADEAADVLDGIRHEVLTGDERDSVLGGTPDTLRRAGGAPQTAPEQLLDWQATATGRDDVTITWTPTDGSWVFVVLPVDGSAGFSVRGSIGVELPYVTQVGWGMVGFGVLLGLLATALVAIGARHPRGPSGDQLPQPGSVAPAATSSGAGEQRHSDGAVAVTVRHEHVGRWLWLVKWLLLIPHYIVLAFLAAAFVVCTVIAWFAVVFTGRFPRALFDFNLGVLRWNWRVNGYGYGAFATDRYPPFSLGPEPEYPVTLDIEYPERLSRGLPFVKWLLALPHLALIGAAAGGVAIGSSQEGASSEIGVIGLLVLFLGAGLLFTGRRSQGIFDLLIGLQRWIYRTIAYVALMTDEYPPFRLDQGSEEPRCMPPD